MEPDVATLLRDASRDSDGNQPTAELFAALYDELHRLAERQLHRDGGGAALSATTLVHEAYLDLSSRGGADFPDRARFIGYAGRAMRSIVIDYVRYSNAAKRGGGAMEITLTSGLAAQEAADELEQLSEALESLASIEPTLAELVDLHFFCGYGMREIAELRGVTERTVQRSWRKARLLLRHQMLESHAPEL